MTFVIYWSWFIFEEVVQSCDGGRNRFPVFPLHAEVVDGAYQYEHRWGYRGAGRWPWAGADGADKQRRSGECHAQTLASHPLHRRKIATTMPAKESWEVLRRSALVVLIDVPARRVPAALCAIVVGLSGSFELCEILSGSHE